MNVLVLNCGSSSLKFQLIDTDLARAAEGTDRLLAKGIVEDIGGTGILKLEASGRPAVRESAEVLEHKIAVEKVVDWLCRPGVGILGSPRDIHAVGHRIVHGGERFKSSVRMDDAVLRGIEDCFEMAPLHNPPNVNGCSVAAIRGGKSVDTSMGFTPLEGLMMGSRSGDLDPAIVLHVMRKEELGPWEMDALLNKHSGLIGLSGISNDMRALLDAEREGNARARVAVEVFSHRLKKYIGAYIGVLGGIDGIAFAGGIGENAPAIRRRALEGLEALGLSLDRRANDDARGKEAEISPSGARVRAFVVPTNEEILIARDTLHLVSGRSPS